MDLKPRGYDKVIRLIDKGVTIPNPLSLDIGDDVETDRISADGVIIYPGCRIYGSKTVISAGCRLGAEGPVTLDDCRLGPKVELKGGYFTKSVFLEKATLGLGAQVREGCLVEEEANGAHCVGLKQTILFPFVTLGSLINLCDCLLSGGTSRTDHSEIGSSYVHFNYTPDGDKTTASLFGDVPRGVMLDQPPIFLGGQGGAVGPVRVGFGTVVAAGSILRHDVVEDGQLVVIDPPSGFERDHRLHTYRNLTRVVANNILYLANLVALEQWYKHVRAPYFARQEMGDLVYAGALETLSEAKAERVQRLVSMATKVPVSAPGGHEFRECVHQVCALFDDDPGIVPGAGFLDAVEPGATAVAGNYLETVQGLTPDLRTMGIEWLQRIVDGLCEKSDGILSSMNLFDTRR